MNNVKFKLPLKSCLVYLILISVLLTGVTFSKHLTQTVGGDKARSISIEEIAIAESGDFVSDDSIMIIPGQAVSYKAEVQYGGSEAATYLFVEMVLSDKWLKKDSISYIVENGGTEVMGIEISDKWTYLKSEGNIHVFYQEVSPNVQVVDSILKNDSVSISKYITEDIISGLSDVNIKFRSVVVQLDEFDSPSDAWSSIN